MVATYAVQIIVHTVHWCKYRKTAGRRSGLVSATTGPPGVGQTTGRRSGLVSATTGPPGVGQTTGRRSGLVSATTGPPGVDPQQYVVPGCGRRGPTWWYTRLLCRPLPVSVTAWYRAVDVVAPPDDTLAEDVDLHVSIARVVLLTVD